MTELGRGWMAREIAGESAAICRLRRSIAQVAALDTTVLFTGETGVGKGLMARALHRASPRRRGAFVHADCASLAPSLIESELFGHERGAFTGAHARRPGRFERAARGTIFLDEVGELDPKLQTLLLRVLQDREYERVGGNESLAMTAPARCVAWKRLLPVCGGARYSSLWSAAANFNRVSTTIAASLEC